MTAVVYARQMFEAVPRDAEGAVQARIDATLALLEAAAILIEAKYDDEWSKAAALVRKAQALDAGNARRGPYCH
jgi:hypothetical protein